MVDYTEIPALRHFVLEDSYVLEVLESGDSISIQMDLVYAKDHPEMRRARSGEWTYVREGVLRFREVTEFEWTDRSLPAREADGSRSWNGFDVFKLRGNENQLRGDVGSMRIVAQLLEVEMTGPI